MNRRTLLQSSLAATLAGGLVRRAAGLSPAQHYGVNTDDELRAKHIGAVPAARSARLSKGVNLSHWLWLPQQDDNTLRWRFIQRPALDALREAGFTHVRLPLDPNVLWDREAMALRPGAWGEAEYAADLCQEAGLSVIIDVHPLGSRSAWIMPDPDTGATPHLEGLWSALAPRCSAWDPERVVLEIMNEPHDITQDGAWAAAQLRTLAIIRDACPAHTIICTGDQWGGVDGLLKLEPVPDANIIYSFHFYDPMTFTHQGATWGWEGWKHLRDVPYPCTLEQAKQLAKTIDDERGRKGLIGEHGDDDKTPTPNGGWNGWNAARIGARIDRAVAWATTHAVHNTPLPLYCGEFGAIKQFAPSASRLAWLKDVAHVCTQRRIGWAMWDYCGSFALTDLHQDKRVLDADVIAALALKTS